MCFKKVRDYCTNKTTEILVSSLYDGDHFGELAMIGKGKQKNINTLEMPEYQMFDETYSNNKQMKKNKENLIKKKIL